MRKKLLFLNIPLLELSYRCLKGGGISINRLHVLLIYFVKLVLSIPLTFSQYIIYSHKIRGTSITKNPVFILGHYRSGTTYLHKLMASDRRFGYLTNFDVVFPNSSLLLGKRMQRFLQKGIKTLKIKNDFFNDSLIQLNDPAEEDHFLVSKGSAFSAYWGFIFPDRFRAWLHFSLELQDDRFRKFWKKAYLRTLKLITFKNNGKQLVLKNPSATERIKYLLELFPNAKFIYIYRNPIDVFCSMKNIWHNGIMKLYCLQTLSDMQVDDIILEHFSYLNDQYQKDKHLIPAENLIELRYEELEKNPVEVIRKIYAALQLANFEATKSDLFMQLQKEKKYHKFTHQYNEETLRNAELKLEKHIAQWNHKKVGLVS